jgi:hypothetical protein
MSLAVSGLCDIRLVDGEEQLRVPFYRPDRGLMMPPTVWHDTHDFAPRLRLLVLANYL